MGAGSSLQVAAAFAQALDGSQPAIDTDVRIQEGLDRPGLSGEVISGVARDEGLMAMASAPSASTSGAPRQVHPAGRSTAGTAATPAASTAETPAPAADPLALPRWEVQTMGTLLHDVPTDVIRKLQVSLTPEERTAYIAAWRGQALTAEQVGPANSAMRKSVAALPDTDYVAAKTKTAWEADHVQLFEDVRAAAVVPGSDVVVPGADNSAAPSGSVGPVQRSRSEMEIDNTYLGSSMYRLTTSRQGEALIDRNITDKDEAMRIYKALDRWKKQDRSELETDNKVLVEAIAKLRKDPQCGTLLDYKPEDGRSQDYLRMSYEGRSVEYYREHNDAVAAQRMQMMRDTHERNMRSRDLNNEAKELRNDRYREQTFEKKMSFWAKITGANNVIQPATRAAGKWIGRKILGK
ncbi:MAG: hypothetical protein K1X83_11810 [Oligoflexia bacterium]|nr:hypothetical protein [Oligoflexia bacterium]